MTSVSVSLPIFTGKPESFYISTSADSERLRSYRGPVTVDLNLPETVAFAVTPDSTQPGPLNFQNLLQILETAVVA